MARKVEARLGAVRFGRWGKARSGMVGGGMAGSGRRGMLGLGGVSLGKEWQAWRVVEGFGSLR